jgi:hypothetical protein
VIKKTPKKAMRHLREGSEIREEEKEGREGGAGILSITEGKDR